MSSFIIKQLYQSVPINITPELAKSINRLVLQYELHADHPLTINSQLIGVHKFIFTTRDRDTFFDIIDVNERDVVDAIKLIPSIDKSHKVVSDAFNVMSVYLSHKILNSKLPEKLKIETVVNVLNYQQYRFIASAINYYLPYKANYDIMQTVVEGLNLKFSIKRAGTWKKVVKERSESLIHEDKLHRGTLLKFDDDKKIRYVITDTSTRIRSQLKNIVSLFRATKKANDFIRSVSATTEIDGEKVLRERSAGFEQISSIIFHKAIRKSPFINDQYIKMVQSTVPTLNVGIIRRMIISISDEANIQMNNDTTNLSKKKRDGSTLHFGMNALISKIVYLIYDSAIHNKSVNINSKIAVYNNTRSLFAVHRSSDSRILNAKMSIVDMIRRNKVSTRDATISSLVISLTLYITLMSFESTG